MPSTAEILPPSDVRVQDYLNDKFQTLSDLDSFDTLITTVQTQQQQLRDQLVPAKEAAISAQNAYSSHSSKLFGAVESFERTQISIDSRLAATFSTGTAADDAADQFKAVMEKLQRLDIAKGYVAMLLQVHELSEEARERVGGNDPEGALKPYTKLQELVNELKKRNSAAEDAAVHLVAYVEGTTDGLWKDMKQKLVARMEDVLKEVKWPTESPVFADQQEREFRDAFNKLLILQGPSLQETNKQDGAILLPLETLVKPLALRFRYHFEGDKPTNRVDKPEWFLAHITSLVTSYAAFLTNIPQSTISSSANPLINSRDAITEFTTALLPTVRRKTKHLLPLILDQAQLLSHFIHELIKFDAELRDEFCYAPFGYEGPWKGITHEVLVVENGFTGWLKVEKEFALSRYHTILAADDAWVLDYDSVEPTDSKPTKSAMRLKDLLESVTDSYRPLISFSQRLRFLIDIQIEILDRYLDRLNSSVEAFRVLSSSIARAVQGTSKEEVQSLSGISGLERLCKVYGSSIYLENCMRDWTEDIFFLEFWEDFQTLAAKTNHNKPVTGSMNLQEVASVTSNAVVNGDEDGALFDETVGSYKRVRSRTEEMIINLVLGTIKDELKAYTKIHTWSSITNINPTAGSNTISPAVSPELVTPLTTLTTQLAFLARTLSSTYVLRRIWRSVSAGLQSYLWDYVVQRNQFSLLGGQQLARDIEELWRVGSGGDFPPTASAVGKLGEACLLLSMGTASNTEGFSGQQNGSLGGLKIVDAVFKGNEEAREMLEKLGIGKALTVVEARSVLQRRVDAFGS